MVVRISDKTQNYSKVTKLLVKPNKISILIPCHRVIGSNNNLTGYAGGIERKEYLLKFEKKNEI